jgi:nitrogen regulatory protein PII
VKRLDFMREVGQPVNGQKHLILAESFLGHSSCCGWIENLATEEAGMKRIEAIIARSALDDFQRCAKDLGIFGFDLSVQKTRPCHHRRLSISGKHRSAASSKIKVDFAVLDEQTKPTVHAVLETVHPESIGIFKFDEDACLAGTERPRTKLA